MQDGEEILASFKHVLVNVLRMLAWHALVPQVNDDQDVLDTHLLQLGQELLSAPLLISVIKSLHDAFL